MKLIVFALLGAIVFSLVSAVIYMMRGHEADGHKMVRALAWRISLSVALFMLLLIGYWLGWIQPNTPRF